MRNRQHADLRHTKDRSRKSVLGAILRVSICFQRLLGNFSRVWRTSIELAFPRSSMLHQLRLETTLTLHLSLSTGCATCELWHFARHYSTTQAFICCDCNLTCAAWTVTHDARKARQFACHAMKRPKKTLSVSTFICPKGRFRANQVGC